MSYFNPFNDLYSNESNKHIHARTLRTSLWGKMKDTFFVFSGTGLLNHFRDKDIHVGLFDYATLGIPLLVDYAHTKRVLAMESSKESTLGTRIILLIILLGTNAVRYSLAAVFTLLVSPIVLATHAVSSFVSSAPRESVDKLPVTLNYPSQRSYHHNDKSTLGSLLAIKDEGYAEKTKEIVQDVMFLVHGSFDFNIDDSYIIDKLLGSFDFIKNIQKFHVTDAIKENCSIQ